MNSIETIVNESGLALSDAEEIKQSYLPFFGQIAEVKEQSKKINFENPSELDERIARELRLRTVKIRTGSEEVKNNRKRIYQLRANIEQDSWNLIKSTCLIDEEMFAQVEKARERKEIARIESLKQERLALLAPYEFDPSFTDLSMPEDSFSSLLAAIKLAHNAKKEAEAKAQLERIEKEKAEALERERIRMENERLKKEREEIDREQEKERKAADAKLKAERVKAEKAQAEQTAIIKKERESRELAERELRAAKEADEQRKIREAEKIEAERLSKIAAEKRAAKAPDKTKLILWIDGLSLPDIQLSQNESRDAAKSIEDKFNAFKSWAKKEINQL